MKKIILALALSTSLLYAQTLPIDETTEIEESKTIIDTFVDNYQTEIESIILEEFQNIVIMPTTNAIINDVNNRLSKQNLDIIEAQKLIEELDSNLLDSTINSLVKTTAQSLANELQTIIQESILDSIDKNIDVFYSSELINTETTQTEAITENTQEEEQKIEESIELTKIEPSTPVVKEIEKIEEEIPEPFVSPAPEKIDYIASPTVKKSTEPVISQTINLTVGDYHDVILNGEGWIYLGEVTEPTKPVVSFYNRYMDGIDSYFGFDAINPGTTTLHFYKQDIIGRTYIDEYVKINVKQQRTTYTNNNYVNKQEESLGISAEPEVSLSGGGSAIVIHDTSATDYGFVPETILDEAESAFDSGNFEDSLALLDEYTSMGTKDVDRALYLYAKNYESNSPQRNVKLAHSYYNKIIDTFPDSQYVDESEKRILYLERFYLVIR